MAVGIIVCIIFVIVAALMMTRKLPALLAMPVLAVSIAAVAGMPLKGGEENIFSTVLSSGALKLANNYVIVIFASWLAQMMYKTGVTDTMIKKAAELGGDKPVVITLLLSAVSILLFSSMGGVGAVSMVGSTVLPILISIGIKPMAAAHLFLAAMSAGYCIRPANMASIVTIFGIELSDLTVVAWILLAAEVIYLLIYLAVYMKKNGKKYAFAALADENGDEDLGGISREKKVTGIRGLLACMTPLLIVVLTFVFKVDPIPCFIIGIVWLMIFTYRGSWSKYVSMVTESCYNGIHDAAPPVILMMGIGMTLNAVSASITQAALLPFMQVVTPTTLVGLLIFCCVLSPLSLYRGPFNVLGLGACLATCILNVGNFPAVVLAAVFYCTFRWPAQACPTATQVVWTSNFVKCEPVTLTNKVLIPNWIETAVTIVVVGLIYSMAL
ncbi:MAG: C4-dicarboxylate ABC transporter [Lachnospiraceae bacterium]|jgi:L-lactate permease|nr:C4-dicarboxylate ABC transporter [Lachnospiraceae bacterium]